MTVMPLAQQVLIIDTTAAHNGLLHAVRETQRFFESAVAGPEAVEDIEAKLAEMEVDLSTYRGLHETMRNEWTSYRRTVEAAYANFARDVVHRFGVDDKSHVRNLALSTAAGAFTRIRDNARAHLTRTLESIRD